MIHWSNIFYFYPGKEYFTKEEVLSIDKRIKKEYKMKKEESVSLYYREGSSDKVYRASLEKSGDGWIVNFSYGRRGAGMNNGTKTSSPLDYETAHGIWAKLVMEKEKKGYVPDESGKVFQ